MNVRDFLARARTAYRIGDTRLAEHLLKQLLETRPRMSQAHNLLGLVYDRAASYRQAVESFRKAIGLRRNYAEAYNNLGVTLRKLRRHEEAIAAFSRALEFSHNRADVHYNLGNVFKSMGRHDQAIEQFTRAIAANPSFTPAYNNLGTAYEQTGRLGEAVSAYRRGLEIDANHPHLHYNLGIALQKTGNLPEAQGEFERALRVRPGWVEALNNLGVVYQMRGEQRKALRVLQDLLRIDPDNLQARNNLGVVHAEMGAAEQAARYYRDALKINPAYAPAASNLGSLFEKGGNLSEALDEFERLAALSPDNLEARYRLGKAYLELERFEEGAAALNEVLGKQPNHLASLRALARYHQQQGRNREAESLYRRLLDLDPGNIDYHLDIAQAAWKRGDLARAERELKRYLARAPDDQEVRLRLGELYLQSANYRHAASLFKEILERQPDNVEAHAALAQAYRKMGEPHQALEALENVVTLQGSGDAPQALGRLSETLDLYEETISEYGQPFRERWAGNLERLRELGRRPEARGREAAEELQMPEVDGDDDIPIINIGGREPVLSVAESEERIDLDAVEESETGVAEEPMVELRDETPLSLVSLLDGQSLYEENPNWRDYQPPPFAREPGPEHERSGRSGAERDQPLSAERLVRRGAPAARPVSPQAALPSTAPSYEAAPSPRPQAESSIPQGEFPTLRSGDVLAESLRESVRAQAEMIRRLEEELRELPRRISPAPQYVFPPGFPPISAATPREPEPAAASAEPERQATPPRLPEHPSGEPIFAPAESLEEVPRYVGDDEGEEQEGETAELAEATEPGEDVVVREASEDFLEPGEEPEESSKGLRQRLRDFLRRVRARLEQRPVTGREGEAAGTDSQGSEPEEGALEPIPAEARQAGLLDYLEELAEYLPEQERSGFRHSDARLKIEYIKAKLQGKTGIRRQIETRFAPAQPAAVERSGMQGELSLEKIADTFAFIGTLAEHHPDKNLGTMLQSKVKGILQKIRG